MDAWWRMRHKKLREAELRACKRQTEMEDSPDSRAEQEACLTLWGEVPSASMTLDAQNITVGARNE